jgi:hypothetical protein
VEWFKKSWKITFSDQPKNEEETQKKPAIVRFKINQAMREENLYLSELTALI